MLRIFNSLTRKKEVFRPLKDKKVFMYVCGPTVYGPSHLGHARTYLVFDMIRRYLAWRGFKMTVAMNITDVHDDIVSEAKRLAIPVSKLSRKYTREFLRDLKTLSVKKPDVMPKVTLHVPDIIAFVKTLVKKGFAYRTDDGVYFKISKFKAYGRLSGIRLKKSKTGTRVQTDKYEKEDVADFALWKLDADLRTTYPSPWGRGRPGWHIECSAMSQKYLGTTFDIHGGARDLLFPHHENEIAQSESRTGKPFVRYWLHSGLLTINGKKMSKSMRNFITLQDALRTSSPRLLRFFVLRNAWGSRLDFSEDNLRDARNALMRLDEFLQNIASTNKPGNVTPDIARLSKELQTRATRFMDDNFNTPKAVAEIFRFIKAINARLDTITLKDAQLINKTLSYLDVFFLWIKSPSTATATKKSAVPKLIKDLVLIRETMRREKNFAEADRIRLQVERLGYKIEDTKRGPRIKILNSRA